VFKRILVLILFTLILSGCQTTLEPNINTPDQGVLEENEPMFCKNEPIVLNQTTTLDANRLFETSSYCSNVSLKDGYIVLENNDENGIIETSELFIENFTEIVPSWNVLLENDDSVSLSIAVGNQFGFSEYLPYALFKKEYKSSFSTSNEFAQISVDTVRPVIDSDRVKIKVILKGDSKLQSLSITSKNDTLYPIDYTILKNIELAVLSKQQLSIEGIGNRICSPTSLSMILEYYNVPNTPVETAGLVYDSGSDLYGNWSFNASLASLFHLYSRVEYTKDLSVLFDYIEVGIPLALSIKTTSKDDLEGSIMPYSGGHLVVLTGFVLKEDTWYMIINDPAEYQDSLVRREYKVSEVLNAMSGYIYVVSDEVLK
jgi:hypothetical protein